MQQLDEPFRDKNIFDNFSFFQQYSINEFWDFCVQFLVDI